MIITSHAVSIRLRLPSSKTQDSKHNNTMAVRILFRKLHLLMLAYFFLRQLMVSPRPSCSRTYTIFEPHAPLETGGTWRNEKFLDSSAIFKPEVFKTIEKEIDKLSPDLRDLSLKIHGDTAIYD